MTTYKSLKSLCESFDVSFYEIPELSDQELNKTPEDATQTGPVGLPGFLHTEETKQLMSELAKRRPPPSAETRAKLATASKNRVMKNETREKLRNNMKGFVHSEETKKKISMAAKNRTKQPMAGATHTEETKKKMSESAKKRERLYSEETLEKWRQARLGKPSPMSEEARKRISEAVRLSNIRRKKEGKV
jgi:hypothetical protein